MISDGGIKIGNDAHVWRDGSWAQNKGYHAFKGLCHERGTFVHGAGCSKGCSTANGGVFCPKGWVCIDSFPFNQCGKLRYTNDYCQMKKHGVGAMYNCHCNKGLTPLSWQDGQPCLCYNVTHDGTTYGNLYDSAYCTDYPPEPPADGPIKLTGFKYRWRFETSNADVTYTTKVTTSDTHKSSWSNSIKAGLKAGAKGTAGVPLVSAGEVSVEVSLENTASYGEEFSSTAALEKGLTVRPNCDQGDKVYAWVLQAKDANGENFEVMSKHFACKKSHIPGEPICTPETLIHDSDNKCCNAIFWDEGKEKPEYLDRLWEEAPGRHNGRCKYQPPAKTA